MSKSLPPLIMSEADHEALASLVAATETLDPAVADYLDRELNRARLVPPGKVPADVTAMGRSVTYRDEATGRTRVVTLVYPGEQDASTGRISVLTPVGAALIGMRVGQTIAWADHMGGIRNLTVLEVSSPATP